MRSARPPCGAEILVLSNAAPHNPQLRIILCGAPHKPEFGPNWVRCRLVKLDRPVEDGATHIALWEPRDR